MPKLVLILLIIQSVRIGLLQVLLQINDKAMLYRSFLLIPISILLYLCVRPSLGSMGLDAKQLDKRLKVVHLIGSIIVIVLALLSPSLWLEPSPVTIISVVESVLIYPVFEELLFRGYVWGKLEKRFEGRRFGGIEIIALNSLLFGLWHLGYLDVIYMRTQVQLTSTPFVTIMFYKVLTGMVFGVLTGVARWRLKSTYGSILVHSLLNIFGR